MQIEDRVRIGELFTEYGGLLTEKQRTTINEYCELDLSLFEIAEQYGITRQGVRDTIMRASCQLEEYERVLGTVVFKKKLRANIDNLMLCEGCKEKLDAIKEMLEG